jgi:hypothetical protein
MTNPANTYSWKINHLIVKDQDSFTRVVNSVHYTVRATQGDYSVEHTDEVAIATGDLTQSFTPFADLSEELVMSWVMSTFSVEQISAILGRLDTRLDQLINPPLRISGDLPWMPATGAPDTPVIPAPEPQAEGYSAVIPEPVTTGTDFVWHAPDVNIPVRP